VGGLRAGYYAYRVLLPAPPPAVTGGSDDLLTTRLLTLLLLPVVSEPEWYCDDARSCAAASSPSLHSRSSCSRLEAGTSERAELLRFVATMSGERERERVV
jgi:hypothetical protein